MVHLTIQSFVPATPRPFPVATPSPFGHTRRTCRAVGPPVAPEVSYPREQTPAGTVEVVLGSEV